MTFAQKTAVASVRVLRRSLVTAVLAAAAPALAQQDVQITTEMIARACREIHKAPNAEAPPASIGPGGSLVLNCRLLAPGGVTIAQVAPAEVCQRATGTAEWYRGMGTQVYCRGRAAGAPPPAR